MQQPTALRLVEGGIPTEGTVAHVLLARYADHLPLPKGSDLGTPGCGDRPLDAGLLVRQGGAELAPVAARLKHIVLASARIFADETVVPVLDPGRGRTRKGYF